VTIVLIILVAIQDGPEKSKLWRGRVIVNPPHWTRLTMVRFVWWIVDPQSYDGGAVINQFQREGGQVWAQKKAPGLVTKQPHLIRNVEMPLHKHVIFSIISRETG
jgi:hypothetical protein